MHTASRLEAWRSILAPKPLFGFEFGTSLTASLVSVIVIFTRRFLILRLISSVFASSRTLIGLLESAIDELSLKLVMLLKPCVVASITLSFLPSTLMPFSFWLEAGK